MKTIIRGTDDTGDVSTFVSGFTVITFRFINVPFTYSIDSNIYFT